MIDEAGVIAVNSLIVPIVANESGAEGDSLGTLEAADVVGRKGSVPVVAVWLCCSD